MAARARQPSIMRCALILATIPAWAGPAVVSGVVLENHTGYAMARSRVKLARLVGDRPVAVETQLTGRSGQFAFRNVAPGYYFVSAVRTAFAEASYGQRRPNAPGAPVLVAGDANVFLELRLKRLASIGGRIVDENRSGLPGVTAGAYTHAPPVRLVASAVSDDRGIYRISGLPAGRYVVRTSAATLDDGFQLMPTYFPFATTNLRDARVVDAELDRETGDVDIQPAPGRLSAISAKAVTGCIPGTEVKVTLSHETGRREARIGCLGGFAFQGLAPGEYELLVEGLTPTGPGAGFDQIGMGDRERGLGSIRIDQLPNVEAVLTPPIPGAKILLRRRDLTGAGEVREAGSGKAPLQPGYWDIAAATPPTHFTEKVQGDIWYRAGARYPDPDWFSFSVQHNDRGKMALILSAPAAAVSGRVTMGGSAAVGAPVYVLPLTAETRRQVNGVKQTIAGEGGRYAIGGLANGDYLVLASWDAGEITEESLRAARATPVKIEGLKAAAVDLEALAAP